jgi:Putative  PD-(D/E)XK family member, (DUF4420)
VANVFEQFKSLHPATSNTEFEALRLPGYRSDYLAKGQDGSPVFLLHDAKTGQYHPILQLRYLTAEFQLSCRLHTSGEEIDDVFALVGCTAEEQELHELFIRSFDAARNQLPEGAHTEEIKRTVQNLASLFRAFAKPSQRSITGLWAELFTIIRSGNVLEAMKMWRAGTQDRFDFSAPECVAEIKATVGQSRSHEFNLEQLSAPVNGSAFVVSVLLQSISGGTSILELIATIEAGIEAEPKMREKLWANVISDLGSDFNSSLDRRFDTSYADRNLTIFLAADIPKPSTGNDPRVTAIRFVADCTGISSSVADSSTDGLRFIFRSM